MVELLHYLNFAVETVDHILRLFRYPFDGHKSTVGHPTVSCDKNGAEASLAYHAKLLIHLFLLFLVVEIENEQNKNKKGRHTHTRTQTPKYTVRLVQYERPLFAIFSPPV